MNRTALLAKMSSLTVSLLIAAVFVSMAGTASAEVIYMKNGDQLSGSITAKTVGKISLKTPYAGTIYIFRSEIRQIGGDAPDKGGGVGVARKIDAASGAAVAQSVSKSAPIKSTKVKPPISALDPTLVAAARTKDQRESKENTFVGNVNFAMKLEEGNNSNDEYDVNFYLNYSQGPHRYHVYGQFEYDLRNSENVKLDWQLYPTYDYYISDKLYVSLAYSAKQEKYAGLDLRQSMGPSIGYQFYKGDPIDFKTSVGFYYVQEDYTDKELNEYMGPGWNMDYKHDLFRGKMQFFHRHYSSLSLVEFDKFLWHSWTGFKVPVVQGVVITTEFEIDYDGQPGLDAETLDTILRVSLGYEW